VYLHESLKIDAADYSTCNACKNFAPEVILHSVVKCTNEEAYREGKNDFDLSLCELVLFIALQCVRGLTYFIFFTINLTVF